MASIAPVSNALDLASAASSPWPTSAVYATTSAPYSSMIHLRITEVSSPPE